ncbi:MAG: hypothetical protein AAF489_05580 [Bacteroidota bacterium]
MKEEDEFYIGYVDQVPKRIRKSTRKFVVIALVLLLGTAAIFALTQNTFKNSSFELTTNTKITGVYHEMPYPMLKVQTSENSFKNILLLGFGKSSANPFLKRIREEIPQLSGTRLSIEGNLIYFNGKTLLQITDDQKIAVDEKVKRGALPSLKIMARNMELQGEIIDPKCYFGVMKPGKGKIHRSCAVRCISGGIPPVLATTDGNNVAEYYLLTDTKGQPINESVLPFVGKPSIISGTVVQLEDWYQLRIDISNIKELHLPSSIY